MARGGDTVRAAVGDRAKSDSDLGGGAGDLAGVAREVPRPGVGVRGLDKNRFRNAWLGW